MQSRNRLVSLLLAALALGAVGLTFSACGYESDSKDVVEGEVVKLGDLKYQVIFSRFLNIHDNEDSAYLVGQPPPQDGSSYFGVFLEVQNKSEETQKLADSFSIEDADHVTYDAIPSESLYAFPAGGKVDPAGTDPEPRLDPAARPDRGLARPLRNTRNGLAEPPPGPLNPRPWRPGRSNTGPVGPGWEGSGPPLGEFAARASRLAASIERGLRPRKHQIAYRCLRRHSPRGSPDPSQRASSGCSSFLCSLRLPEL